jgi:hypothetical protein
MRSPPYGNGVTLWFQNNEFDAAVKRVVAYGAHILENIRMNSNANHPEVWLQDADGYEVVLAGAYGDLDAS